MCFDQRIMNSDPIVSATSAPDCSSNDEQVEALLVRLLGQLEQQLTSIERTDNVKRMIRMIETALSMLVTTIDTGMDNFGPDFFTHELPSVWRLRERSKVVLDVLDRESWTSMFGLSPKANSATQVMHRNLGKSFAQIYRDLFARFGEELQSAELRAAWTESGDVFVDDFLQRW